jgi:TetR/AcrR family transcriptional regulator, fatty acid biosynthesis regulator
VTRAKPKRRGAVKLARNKSSEITQRKLIDGAIEILRHEGLNAATTGRIAQAAGLKQPTFYAHFADRDEVLEAAAIEICRRMAEKLASHLTGFDLADKAASLRSTYEALVSGYLAHPELTRLFLRHRIDDGSPLGRVFSRFLASSRALLYQRFSKFSAAAGEECVNVHIEMLQANMLGVVEAIVEHRLQDRALAVRAIIAAESAALQWLREQAQAAVRAR